MSETDESKAWRLRWLIPMSVVAGCLSFAFSCLFMEPTLATWNLGDDYARMADDPFGGRSASPFRVLSPLLAYLLGFGSAHYWIFAHACVVAFLASVFAAAVVRGSSLLGAMILAMIISITGAVEVYKGHVGYPEPLSYTLLLWSTFLMRRTTWFWLMLFCALQNHENTLFLWPWLVYMKVAEVGGVRRADVVAGAITLVAAMVARWVLMGEQSARSLSFYWDDQNLSFVMGMWVLDVVAVVVYFGGLLTVLAWHAWFDGLRRVGVEACLAFLGILAMSFFAADLQRFVCFLAVPMVLAAIRLLQQPAGTLALSICGIVTAAVIVWQRQFVLLIYQTMVSYPPDPVSAVPGQVVPALWHVFLGYAIAIVAMILLGRSCARRWPAEAPVEPT